VAYDVAIVGGGSAGCVLAARLTEDPARRVLLLEAGGGDAIGGPGDELSNVTFGLTLRDWGLRAQLNATRDVDYPQGRFLGGGSSVNGALALRGLPGDFDRWAQIAGPQWSWTAMLPAFERLERDEDHGTAPGHGNAGPIPIVRYAVDELVEVQRSFRDAAVGNGLPWVDDLNAADSSGIGSFPMNRQRGFRMSTAMTYLMPVVGRSNLEVRTDAHVTRVLVEGSTAIGVELNGPSGTERIDAGLVILAGGSIQSPALLWRSGIGPAPTLQSRGIRPVVENPNVGEHLVDHPGVFAFFALGEREPNPDEPQFQIGARYTSTTGENDDDMFLSMMNIWDVSASRDFAAMLGADKVTVLTCGVHAPRSSGRLIAPDVDPNATPGIDLNLLDDPADTQRLVEGVRRCRSIATQMQADGTLGRPLLVDDATLADDAAMAEYVAGFVAPWYHPTGTCRMGAEASSSVVDGRLQVHGVTNLHVVDASVMPSITRAPTNLSTIAIAERAVEFLT
jgi:choline dehydrogenase